MIAGMKKLLPWMVGAICLGAAGIWAAVWFMGSQNNSQGNIPGYGDPLVSSTPGGNQAIDQLTSGAPTTQELTQYEKHKDSKQILFGEITAGTGTEAKSESLVAIAYKGYLTNGQLFDQTKDKALSFKIGAQGIIPGMQMGVAGMKVGGKRRIIIPPALGYGSKAHGPLPASSVLIFDVELLAVQ